MISWQGGKRLYLLIVGLGLLFEAQNDPSQDSSEEIIAKLKATTAARLVREAEEAKARNSIDRTIDSFIVEQCPLYYAIYGIRQLGINLCHETIAGQMNAYVDPDGVSVFASDRPISIHLKDATIREILDRVCEADPRYAWTHDERRGLVVLAPKEQSRLQVLVGPLKDSGNPTEVLQRLHRTSKGSPFAPGIGRGGNNLPDIALDSSRCTATELLNQIVSQHPGMTWSYGGSALFRMCEARPPRQFGLSFLMSARGRLRTVGGTIASWNGNWMASGR